ncbi:MAG: bifunctional precorrin-2 dehydrogenase/sirohydrochlorin ferrochelatase [Phycisphaerae bacterium]
MQEGYYILLELKKRRCIVIGGGSIATRKIDALRRCEADVHIVAPQFCDVLAQRTDVTFHKKEYEKSDLEGATLSFACTDNAELNHQIFKDSRELRVICNVVDDPDWCDFTVPAVLKRGPIQIAVGTAGASPYLAGRIRDLISGWIDRAYEPFARRLAALRPVIIERINRPDLRKAIFQQLAGRDSFDRFKREGSDSWCEWISQTTQRGLSTEEVTAITAATMKHRTQETQPEHDKAQQSV